MAARLAVARRWEQPNVRGGMSGKTRCGLSTQQVESFSQHAERKKLDTKGYICMILGYVWKGQIHGDKK